MSNYSYLLKLMKAGTKNLKKNHPMKKVAEELSHLEELINTYSAPVTDEDGVQHPQKWDTEKYAQLKDALNRTYEAGKAAHIEGKRKNVDQYLDEVVRLVSRDLDTMNRIHPEAAEDFRGLTEGSYTYTADISGKNLDTVGGANSQRFAMSVPDGKGGYVDGYFTADSRLSWRGQLNEILQDTLLVLKDKQPLFCDELEDLMKNNKPEEIANILFGNADFNDREGEMLRFSMNGGTGICSRNWQNAVCPDLHLELDESDCKILYQMAGRIYSAGFMVSFMKDSAMVADGGVIGQRNAAMTAMADRLGVPSLLARSSQMTVVTGYKDGKPVVRTGVFMEQAEGKDSDEYRNKPVYGAAGFNLQTNKILQDIADLQVLDYICGNIDRHGANYFVKTEKDANGVLQGTGIVGIDNDGCFGQIKASAAKNYGHLRGPASMGYISSSMAEKVKGLEKRDLEITLAGFGLGSAAVSSAWERVQMLKKTIASKQITVVEDNTWVEKNIKLEDFDAANKSHTAEDDYGYGIATSLLESIQRTPQAYEEMKQHYDELLAKYRRKYRSENGLSEEAAVPAEEDQKLIERAEKVASVQQAKREKLYDELKLTGRNRSLDIHYEAAFRQIAERINTYAKESPDKLAEIKVDGLSRYIEREKGHCQRKGTEFKIDPLDYEFRNFFTKNRTGEAYLRTEATNVLMDNIEKIVLIKENPQPVKEHMEALNPRLAHLASLSKKLEDLQNTFLATTVKHGQSKECSRMSRNLKTLLEMTEDMLTNGENQVIGSEEEIWKNLHEQLETTLVQTCAYISKKPAHPKHDYGQARLDMAHDLRELLIRSEQYVSAEQLAAADASIKAPAVTQHEEAVKNEPDQTKKQEEDKKVEIDNYVLI